MDENPWMKLPGAPPYVLECDKAFVIAHNRDLSQGDDGFLDVNLPPGPFQGRFDAPVVVLLANPGWDEGDYGSQDVPPVLDLFLENARSSEGTPALCFTEAFRKSGAIQWWPDRTRDLARDLGDGDLDAGYEVLAQNLLTVELHGYHSKKWTAPLRNFPSQLFAFELVEGAIKRKALIIIVRCRKHWQASVPELLCYRHLIDVLESPRAAHLSRKNLGDNYDRVVTAFRKGHPSPGCCK